MKKKSTYRLGISTGPMLRLSNFMYLYAGAGYGKYGEYYSKDSSGEKLYILKNKFSGLEADAGLLIKCGDYSFGGGYTTLLPFSSRKRYSDFVVNVGFAL